MTKPFSITDFDQRVLLLDPADNIVVARSYIGDGEALLIDGESVELQGNAPIGFKISRSNISIGTAVLKHGAAIGSATAPIQKGQVIHVENMKSDYLPTYTKDKQAYTKRRKS